MDKTLPLGQDGSPITVAQLAQRYLEYLADYLGSLGGEFMNQRATIRQFCEFAGELWADEVGPRGLKDFRQQLIARRLDRRFVNRAVGRIKRMWRWGVEDELLDPLASARLQNVAGLKYGRCQAKEIDPVQPVSWDVLSRTLPALPPVMRDLAMLQYETACRPSEATRLRPDAIDQTDPSCWVAQVVAHKTRHRGRSRQIAIGPRAQKYLAKYLHQEYCFLNQWGLPYSAKRYSAVVRQACLRLGVEPWSPNQLRHTKETAVRKNFGLEAAQVYAGHARADVTQIYAQRDWELAKKVARRFG